ncbi:MAG: TIGR02186 family protein [Rhodospirillaceae bacterium]
MRSALSLFLLLLALASPVRAQQQSQALEVPLMADLSSHLVAITSRFIGTDVLLFGATDGPGDIVVVVTGPIRDETVRRKERVGAIWLNTDQVTLASVPSYYRVVSSRPVEEFAPQTLLARHQIGLANIRMATADADVTPEELAEFRRALIRIKTAQSLYDQGIGAINMMSNRLFRAELHFPSNVPTGTYNVEVFLFRDGQVASAQIVPLNISKVGVGADIYDFAHNLAPLYGLLAVLLAAGAGWAASAVFRRV